jgi:hypothetical protein
VTVFAQVIKAAADFNADGVSDILWQNDNGQAATWLMSGVMQAEAQPRSAPLLDR